jgi:arylsulfatase A-like enzyme
VADADKPNILVIWGDDIGITNLSCYSDGLMGTPGTHPQHTRAAPSPAAAAALSKAPTRGTRPASRARS